MAQQFHTVHLRFDAASAGCPVQFSQMARTRYFDARSASLRAIAPAVVGFQGLAFPRGRMTACALRSAIASWHLRMSWAPSAVTLPICSSAGIWLSRSGRPSASPIWFPVISTARTSSVCSSFLRWILRQTRRLGSPRLRAFHSPSPSILIPVLSAARQGHAKHDPERGSAGAAAPWSRDKGHSQRGSSDGGTAC